MPFQNSLCESWAMLLESMMDSLERAIAPSAGIGSMRDHGLFYILNLTQDTKQTKVDLLSISHGCQAAAEWRRGSLLIGFPVIDGPAIGIRGDGVVPLNSVLLRVLGGVLNGVLD